MGCTLAIDSIFKFMCTTTCLDKIKELRDRSQSDNHFEQMVRTEFSRKSVIGNWGNKRTYIVHDVDFEKSVTSFKFTFNGAEVTIADYFSQQYKLNVRDFKQPLFVVKMGPDFLYLPPEFTILDGVPDTVRKGPGMRDALMQTKLSPQERTQRNQKMLETLLKMKSIQNWGLQLESSPSKVDCTVLGAAQIFKDNEVIHINEQVLRRLPIQKAVDLTRNDWCIIYQETKRGYGKRNFELADKIYKTFKDACGMLKIRVEEPSFIELEKEDDPAELEQKLLDHMMRSPTASFKHPMIAVCVIDRETNYKMFKEVLGMYQIPSQVITCRNGRSFNMSKASNILRQINSKTGGDLY